MINLSADIRYIAEEGIKATEEDEGGQDHGRKALAFVEKVASLKKWGEPDPGNDDEPFEPSDGLDDSHDYLMGLIDMARDIRGQGSGRSPR